MARSEEILPLWCSYGGIIALREPEKSLFYDGGFHRLVSVPREAAATYSSLSAHLSKELYGNRPFELKYKLPSDDLDTLVSIFNDEDVEYMMEEYNPLNPRLIRFFLFPGGVITQQPKTEELLVGSTGVASGNSGVGLDDTTIRVTRHLLSLDPYMNKQIDEFLRNTKVQQPSVTSCNSDYGIESCNTSTNNSVSSWLTDDVVHVIEETEKGSSGVGLDVTTKVTRMSPSLVSLINKYIDEFSKDPSPSDNSCHGDESCSNATYKCPSTSSWLKNAALKDHPSIVMEEREKVISSGEEYSPSPSLMDAVMDCPPWSGSEEVTLDFGVGSGSGTADSISSGGSSIRLPNYAAMRDGDYSFQQHDIKVPLASVVSYESDHSSVSGITINEQNIEYQDAKLVDTGQCTDSPHQNDRLKPEEKLKLWCSYGGRITYDAVRKDLSYVDGESRFVNVPRKTTETYSSLSAHLSKGVYDNRPFVLKCKFPSYELGTLVSIYTDEDVKNVMEEYDSLRASGDDPSRIRFFLFPAPTRDGVDVHDHMIKVA